MIIKKPIEPNSIITFRIVTGESVIARFVTQSATTLTVSKPIIAHAIQQNDGIGISFAPFCVTAPEDQDFKIPISSLLIEPVTPHQELSKSYMRATTSLEIPGA